MRRDGQNSKRPEQDRRGLERVREEMRTVTESILKNAKKRQDIARQVAKIKEANHNPIENLKVEKRLKNQMKEFASNLDLEEDLVERILNLLFEDSKNAQRREIFEEKIRSYLRKKRIRSVFIIGSGRMGRWFASYFLSFGLRVTLFDKRIAFARKGAGEIGCHFASGIAEGSDHDLILLAVPISETERELSRLLEILTSRGSGCKAILEISSIKGASPGRSFNESPTPVISIHPLFGPSANIFGTNSIAVVEDDRRRARFGLNLVRHLFPQYKAMSLSKRSHDEQMALLLTLPHVLALAFRDVSLRKRSRGMSTPSYNAINEFSERVRSENPDLYFEIQSSNQFAPALLRKLRLSLDTMAHFFEAGDKNGFRKRFFESKDKKLL